MIEVNEQLPTTSGFVIAVDAAGEALTVWFDAEWREFGIVGNILGSVAVKE